MQNRAFLNMSSVENLSFFQRKIFTGGYLSCYKEKNIETKILFDAGYGSFVGLAIPERRGLPASGE